MNPQRGARPAVRSYLRLLAAGLVAGLSNMQPRCEREQFSRLFFFFFFFSSEGACLLNNRRAGNDRATATDGYLSPLTSTRRTSFTRPFSPQHVPVVCSMVRAKSSIVKGLRTHRETVAPPLPPDTEAPSGPDEYVAQARRAHFHPWRAYYIK